VDKKETLSGGACAKIQIEPTKPRDRRHEVTSGSFELELAVTTRNADARRYPWS
jgi:hypothetical protein